MLKLPCSSQSYHRLDMQSNGNFPKRFKTKNVEFRVSESELGTPSQPIQNNSIS